MAVNDKFALCLVSSPLGTMRVCASDAGVVSLHFGEFADETRNESHPHLKEAREQLEEYFSGERREFSLALDLRGTAFQLRVWQALLDIPYGATGTYGRIARTLGDPKAVRAVGAANGRNPVSVIVPCHRVIGADGSLIGYGGGIERKMWLLKHEGALLDL